MQNNNKNNNQNNNNKTRNTSYYKSRVNHSPKQKKEKSVYLDKAKKRQWNNYKLTVFVMFILMVVFSLLIGLGMFLNSLVGPVDDTEDTEDTPLNLFTTNSNSQGSQNNQDNTGSVFTPGQTDPEHPQPVEISEIFYNYNGVYLDVEKLESLESLQSFIDNIKSKNINAVNIDIKKEDGTVPYYINSDTDSVMNGMGQIDIPVEDIIKTLHDNDLYVSGTIACFKDSLASNYWVMRALRSSATSIVWEDSAGNYWLNAYSSGARNYISGIIESSVKLGFDEIILSWFFFPNVSNESSIIYEIEGEENNDMTKYEIVKNFVADQMYLLDNIAPKVKLGLEIPVRNFLNLPNETMGLNTFDLDLCNFYATSFDPADILAGSTVNGQTIANPENNPYETVKALCAHFEYISKNKQFRPYMPAYNSQKQALFEYDMNAWQLVNYDDNYY